MKRMDRKVMVAARATAAEALLRAAEILATRGWTRGTLFDEESGAVCALGAINLACFGNALGGGGADALVTPRRLILREAALDCANEVAISRLSADYGVVYQPERNVTNYNDHVARGKTAVVGMLRTAAKQCAGAK